MYVERFSDATIIKIAQNNLNPYELRKLIPKSAVILAYNISKNYATCIWSELAKEQGAKDATGERFRYGKDDIYIDVYVQYYIDIITSFPPFKFPQLISALENIDGDIINILSISTREGFGNIRAELIKGSTDDLKREFDKIFAVDLC